MSVERVDIGKATLYCGDALAALGEMPAGAARCCVTSPPYWGLRDYGTGRWEGGEAECDHKGWPLSSSSSTLAGYTSENVKLRTYTVPFREQCGKCGARRIDDQLGLEATPEEYVAKLVAVFREVRRVLREDGVLFLNLGDSYFGSTQTGGTNSKEGSAKRAGRMFSKPAGVQREAACDTSGAYPNLTTTSLKPKDMVGIPWRVAFALQADGWWLRSDCIWAKPNPMPESVTDRPTKSHEYVFLLAKSERYFFDAEAVKDRASGRASGNSERSFEYINGRSGVGHNVPWPGAEARNLRTVWSIATQPFPGAHFAVMPPKLAERCILAGTSAHGICSGCGKPWMRATEREQQPRAYADRKYAGGDPHFATKRNLGARYQAQLNANPKVTKGWQPSCICNAPVVADTVLDPFAGSGTTGLMALKHGRRFLGVELNRGYLDTLAAPRLDDAQRQRSLFDDAAGRAG